MHCTVYYLIEYVRVKRIVEEPGREQEVPQQRVRLFASSGQARCRRKRRRHAEVDRLESLSYEVGATKAHRL
jgi:hypothetical protein